LDTLSNTVIRKQKSSRPSIRLGLRPIQAAELEACRKRNAFHAPCAPPTVFLPSLRAHKPNPAGLRSIETQAGEFLQKSFSPAAGSSRLCRGYNETSRSGSLPEGD